MSLFSIFNISGSGMEAQSERLNVSASNLANADSLVGPDGKPYQAKEVVFKVAPLSGEEIGGVAVSNVIDNPKPGKKMYEPDNPLANSQGYVTLPNVNVVNEMVNTISASRSYQADVEVFNTAKTLMLKTLTLGQ